jgi:heptosyltransferase-2
MALRCMIPALGDIPAFPVKELEPDGWRDGLLVRSPNWLGDAAMTLPALCVLRKLVPEPCGIFVVCPKGFAPLFEMLPSLVNKVIPLEDAHAFLSRKERKQIRSLRPGCAVLFNNSFRDALSLKWAGVPRLYGTGARFRSLLMERTFSFPPRLDRVLNTPHQAAKYLSMALAMGAPAWDGVLPDFRIPYEPETACEEARKALACPRLLALAPGAAYGAAKRWDTESFNAVAQWWIRERGGAVALLCSGKEAAEARKTLSGLPEEAVFDLGGKTTIPLLALILQKAQACIANDSGIMHFAAVLGLPGVAPFGSTDPAATSPISGKWRLLFDQQSCAPCFKRVCPYGTRACMKAVTPDHVIAALQELLP